MTDEHALEHCFVTKRSLSSLGHEFLRKQHGCDALVHTWPLLLVRRLFLLLALPFFFFFSFFVFLLLVTPCTADRGRD